MMCVEKPVRVVMALLLALACMTFAPLPAFAVVNFGTVSVSLPSQLSLTPNQTTSVNCVVSPLQDMQTPNCETDYCPSGCELNTGRGCQDANGNCICFGSAYSPYYASVSTTSSNPSVARATYSNGTLQVTGHGAGTCTITVYGQLRMWTTGAGTMQVSVSEGGSSAGASSGGTGVASVTPSASGSGSTNEVITVTTVGGSNMAAAAEAVAQGADDDVVELTTDDGNALIVVEAGDAEVAARELAKIAGTEGTCTFWSGGTIDAPLVTWTFSGTTLDPAADLRIDPNVTVTQKGTGVVADLLEDVPDSVVLEFAHNGTLPGPAEVSVNVGSLYEDGSALGLHLFDDEASAFDLVQGGVKVDGGLATFTIDHCSTWALSTTDLSELEPAALPDTGVDEDVTPWGVIGGIVAVAVIAGAIAVFARRRAS